MCFIMKYSGDCCSPTFFYFSSVLDNLYLYSGFYAGTDKGRTSLNIALCSPSYICVCTLQNMVAAPLRFVSLLLTVCFLHVVHGGAVYYGHKQPPLQHQPLPHHNDGYPQQQFLGNEMPHLPYGKEGPLPPQYGKELPQLPLQMGKERPLTDSKGELSPLFHPDQSLFDSSAHECLCPDGGWFG